MSDIPWDTEADLPLYTRDYLRMRYPGLEGLPEGSPNSTEMIDHSLKNVLVIDSTHAEYVCQCGAKGSTHLADHLASVLSVRKRATKNHEMHAVRARIREEKEKAA